MADNGCIFERVEKKYLLSNEQTARLTRALTEDGRMHTDQYGRHAIQNIYYDTPDFELIRTSLDRPAYKEKLRLRCYGVPDDGDTVFVELKKKFDGVVYKRRAPMTLREAELYLRGGPRPASDGQILHEIDYALNFYGASPSMYLAYERVALLATEDPAFRLTLDRNIRFRTQNLRLTGGAYGTPVLPQGTTLMEVKTGGALPLWFVRMLAQEAVYPTTFSKYGNAYRMLWASQKGGLAVA